MADVAWGPTPSGPRPASLPRYFASVVVTVVAIFSQYFVPQAIPAANILYGNLPGDVFVVYGIPLLTFGLLVRGAPLRDWAHRMRLATYEGLRFYGLLSLLGILILIVLVIVYEAVDPSALSNLNRPNPALEQAKGNPWFFVGFSFVVGAVEETIFRGFIFGYWRDRPGSWTVPAVWTSVVFAVVHLYYATTYGAAAPIIFPSLFLIGFAFAATYRYSGGNLVVPAALHGAHDAASFLTLISVVWGAVALYLVILAGCLVALAGYIRGDSPRVRPI